MSVEVTRDGGDIVMRNSNDDPTIEIRWTTPDWNTFINGIYTQGGLGTDIIRDNPEEILILATLRFTSVEWHAFVHGLREGQFTGSGIPGGSWKRATYDDRL